MKTNRLNKRLAQGIALLALGGMFLLFGGIGYAQREEVLKIGPFRATAEKQKRFRIHPAVGILFLVAGAGVLGSAWKIRDAKDK